MKKPRFYIRLREYTGTGGTVLPKVGIWLIERDGPEEASYLHDECAQDMFRRKRR